jgi:serine/threonine-protein phosphatase 4 regulatory subunit 1
LNVRRLQAVAGRIGNIAQAVPKEVIARELVPLFVKMADDEIWGVRKACAESLVSLSEAITAEERATKLVPVFEKLVDDVRSLLSHRRCAHSRTCS